MNQIPQHACLPLLEFQICLNFPQLHEHTGGGLPLLRWHCLFRNLLTLLLLLLPHGFVNHGFINHRFKFLLGFKLGIHLHLLLPCNLRLRLGVELKHKSLTPQPLQLSSQLNTFHCTSNCSHMAPNMYDIKWHDTTWNDGTSHFTTWTWHEVKVVWHRVNMAWSWHGMTCGMAWHRTWHDMTWHGMKLHYMTWVDFQPRLLVQSRTGGSSSNSLRVRDIEFWTIFKVGGGALHLTMQGCFHDET